MYIIRRDGPGPIQYRYSYVPLETPKSVAASRNASTASMARGGSTVASDKPTNLTKHPQTLYMKN